MRLFVNSKRWQVIGFCPRAASAGVFGDKPGCSFPIFGSFEGGAQPNEQGNQTIMREHSHLAIVFYNLNFGEAPGIRKTEFGALSTPWPDRAGSSL